MTIIATLKSADNGFPGNGHFLASIPLNKLLPWDGNVRKTASEAGLEEPTASIAAHGVLQSLVVRKASRGKYSIIAGRRRFLALSSLANDGAIDYDAPVPCRVVPGSGRRDRDQPDRKRSARADASGRSVRGISRFD